MTAIAIDFGTSNTVVAIQDAASQRPQTLVFDRLSRRIQTPRGPVSVVPSLVFVKDAETLMVGESVRSQRLGQVQPDRYFQGFKRDLAADFQPPPRTLDGQLYTAATVSEAFLQTLWQQVQQQGITPSHLMFTVPVGAFERYLDWFRALGDRLAVPTVQLVDESTAAALGYAVRRPGSRVLVIDFGGGTLDLSLVRTVPTTQGQRSLKAEVIAKADAYVGGVDIDRWIGERCLQQLGLTREQIGETGWQMVLERAERLKIRLSSEETATESWLDDESFRAYDLTLTQRDLADLLEDQQLLEQVRQALDEVLAIAQLKGVGKADIELVLLVGGSCQLLAVQQLMLSYFGRQRVKMHKPFEAVAHGAIALSQISEVDDYLHHSYAIRLWEPYSKTYSYFKLFDQGTTYPCSRSEPLTLQVAQEGQTEIRLDIGEVADLAQAELVYDAQGRMTSSAVHRQESYRSLETHHNPVCVARLNPPGQLGSDRITVQFAVTADRTLVATVRDLMTQTTLVEQGAIAKLH
ncbi:MAG: Hsp70 family protein [Leptolyngbya sp. DLM2.Bin15]|nr:MAG: Hsp70 family protein [Leptolyngbya sp. DLM2.Bin15]